MFQNTAFCKMLKYVIGIKAMFIDETAVVTHKAE
jgi:hypothetical protein